MKRIVNILIALSVIGLAGCQTTDLYVTQQFNSRLLKLENARKVEDANRSLFGRREATEATEPIKSTVESFIINNQGNPVPSNNSIKTSNKGLTIKQKEFIVLIMELMD